MKNSLSAIHACLQRLFMSSCKSSVVTESRFFRIVSQLYGQTVTQGRAGAVPRAAPVMTYGMKRVNGF